MYPLGSPSARVRQGQGSAKCVREKEGLDSRGSETRRSRQGGPRDRESPETPGRRPDTGGRSGDVSVGSGHRRPRGKDPGWDGGLRVAQNGQPPKRVTPGSPSGRVTEGVGHPPLPHHAGRLPGYSRPKIPLRRKWQTSRGTGDVVCRPRLRLLPRASSTTRRCETQWGFREFLSVKVERVSPNFFGKGLFLEFGNLKPYCRVVRHSDVQGARWSFLLRRSRRDRGRGRETGSGRVRSSPGTETGRGPDRGSRSIPQGRPYQVVFREPLREFPAGGPWSSNRVQWTRKGFRLGRYPSVPL